MQGLLAGLEAVDGDVAFVASTDMPFLHPRFVAAVCAGIGDADAAVPYADGHRQPLAAAYRTALAPLLAQLVAEDRMRSASLFDRCDARWLEDLPHPESVRNVNEREDYEQASRSRSRGARALLRARGGRTRTSARRRSARPPRPSASARRPRPRGHQRRPGRARPADPLAEDDDVAFMAADPGG